jgi:hypothetical protein
MQSVANKPIMLSVFMLNIVMMSVVAPKGTGRLNAVDPLIRVACFAKKQKNAFQYQKELIKRTRW